MIDLDYHKKIESHCEQLEDEVVLLKAQLKEKTKQLYSMEWSRDNALQGAPAPASNELIVKVYGPAASGKSTIAQALSDMLDGYGIGSHLCFQDGETEIYHVDQRLQTLTNRKTQVTIIESQVARRPNG